MRKLLTLFALTTISASALASSTGLEGCSIFEVFGLKDTGVPDGQSQLLHKVLVKDDVYLELQNAGPLPAIAVLRMKDMAFNLFKFDIENNGQIKSVISLKASAACATIALNLLKNEAPIAVYGLDQLLPQVQLSFDELASHCENEKINAREQEKSLGRQLKRIDQQMLREFHTVDISSGSRIH